MKALICSLCGFKNSSNTEKCISCGAELKTGMSSGLGLRLDKSGFTKGTAESFIEYMKKEYAGIAIKVRK